MITKNPLSVDMECHYIRQVLTEGVVLELILQGLTERTHAEVLGEMFDGEVERAIVSVAFVSEDGVDLVEPAMAPHRDKITVFAGIRNDITSAQALKRLLKIGISLYAVDTGSRNLLFHPKLYHVRSGETVQLSVGSANLTLGGLNNNIEVGVLLKLALDNEDDAAFVNDLEASFDELTAEHPENVFQIADEATIDELLEAGRLTDETVSPPSRAATKAKAGSTDPTPRMKVQPKPVRGKPKPKTAPTLAAPPQAPPEPAAVAPGNSPGASATVAPNLELVWESKPLKRRSLGIPTGANSNPTGSTLLGSGTFDDIDRVTYFRNYLFGHLAWWTSNANIETATQEFDLVIKGVLVGTFDLTLRHSLTRAAAAPVDSNSPTSISWNQARPLIAREDLLDRTMRIWRSTDDATDFQIEID
jgi:HKD family nuclease